MADADEQPANVPRHVAIIMDGNGRWAKQRSLPRIKGHEEGAKSVRAIVRACRDAGVEYLTLYAFSVENWVRPKAEIRALMHLLRRTLRAQERELHEHEVRLRVIGRIEDLPSELQEELQRVMDDTAQHRKGNLVLALSYGGRTELAHAAKRIAQDVVDGTLDVDAIDEAAIGARLYAPDIPDPDFMIRTSGEMRISNFLLWQLSYAELYVTDTYWPDFRDEAFHAAIREYGQRRRRFGDVKEKVV